MKTHLDSDDIIEMFSHALKFGENSAGVSIIPGLQGAQYPPAWLLISTEGVEPLKRTVSNALEDIRLSKLVDPGPPKLNLALLMPKEHSIYYFDIKSDSHNLGFAILLPAGCTIDVPKSHVAAIFSRIFQALCFSGAGWS